MSEAEHLDGVIAKLIADGSTGALEVKSSKKRWLLFFSGGALVFTRSNLKSEQADAIRKRVGDLASNELIRRQAVRRIRNICRAKDVEYSFHADAAPPQVKPVNAITALVDGVRQAYKADVLAQRVAPLLEGFPRVLSDLGGLGLDPTLEAYLQAIDGGRPGADVVAFAPAAPEMVHSVLLVLWQLGDVQVSEDQVDLASIVAVGVPGGLPDNDDFFSDATPPPSRGSAAASARPAAAPAPSPPAPEPDVVAAAPPEDPAPPATSASAGGDFDLGALLDEVVANHRTDGTAPPPPKPEERPPEDSLTAATARPGTEDHPMAQRLHTLARRMRHAADHFELFGVEWDSDPEAFRVAYTDLARELHPDRYHEASEELRELAHELFDAIRVAWEILGSDSKRKEYIDVVIHGKKTPEEEAMEQLNAYWEADDAFKKGLTVFRNGRLREAHAHFQHAAEAVPDELEFQAYYAYTTYSVNRGGDQGASDMGISMLRDVLERNKNQERQLDAGWALLGRAYRESGEPETARRALVHALRINPGNDDALREMRRLERVAEANKPKKGFLAGLFSKK